ncbi:MAG: hypothetical protein WA996_20705 [Candidatus Promineifilaceae bacterium]
MTDSFMRFAGWTAYANARLTIANMVTIMVFFVVGGFWGRLNDSVSVLWALSFIPLAIVLYRVNTPVNGPVSLLAAVIGLSLVFNGLLARSGETLPAALVWLTLAFGLGFVLGGIGFWIGGQQHPLAMAGFLVTALIGPVWAIWLGRLLLNGTLYVQLTLAAGGSA